MKRILIAGIGNVFLGDDAFGVEVVRQLRTVGLPASVQVTDFGIRSYDLAYAIADGYEAVIFVDAAARGERPGTLYLLELDLDNLEASTVAINGHSLNPVAVLQMVRSFEAKVGRLYLVGCEPAVLECEAGRMELSTAVAAAVPQAVKMIRRLLEDLAEADPHTDREPGLVEAAT